MTRPTYPSETTPARQSRGEIRASVRFCGTGRDSLSDADKLTALMRKGETPGQAIKRIVLETWERCACSAGKVTHR